MWGTSTESVNVPAQKCISMSLNLINTAHISTLSDFTTRNRHELKKPIRLANGWMHLYTELCSAVLNQASFYIWNRRIKRTLWHISFTLQAKYCLAVEKHSREKVEATIKLHVLIYMNMHEKWQIVMYKCQRELNALVCFYIVIRYYAPLESYCEL